MIPIGGNQRLPIFPWVVYALIVANLYVFVQELGAPNTDSFINAFAAIPYDITNNVVLASPSPQLPFLTIFTSMFLHGSVLHILFNMLFLFVFGPDIEYLCGHFRFLAFYLLCGVAGGLGQISIGPGSHIPAIGASGAIAGVLGAYLINFPTARVNTIVPIGCFPLFLRLPAVLVIGLWAATQFLHGFGALTDKVASEQGGTAYFAHIGGFCAGVLLIGLLRIRSGRPRTYRYYW
ncbi:MAG: rhomboid family intramembrane serine protease [Candidatus Velthaea sp.]